MKRVISIVCCMVIMVAMFTMLTGCDGALQFGNNKTSQTQGAGSSATNSKLGNDFKKAMDSYESFMDEYVEFMKKFQKNPSDHSILANYATFMSKYASFAEEFAKWENEDLNADELAYYIEVQARVTKKLLEVAN